MYSTYNEGEFVVAERFIKTLKNKTLKHMTAISKNVYFDVLDDIVDKYNNTVHRTIKIKLYTPNWSDEVFISNKIKNTVPWTHAISDLNGKEINGTFYEKELRNTN